MRTRSQARKRQQQQVQQTSVESSNLEKLDNPPIVTMADNRTMAQLLEAPTEGYEDAIVIPWKSPANNFEIKHRNDFLVLLFREANAFLALDDDTTSTRKLIRLIIWKIPTGDGDTSHPRSILEQ
ncbi:hypothetical protein Tco_0747587 [Tanacetum coccineum]|uniref:Reverse transcriptase domain-containing protein n=1 Tax=Tanacetum coccineum TaxID=301880 RepID=A0ABQ4YVP1_9ASTR